MARRSLINSSLRALLNYTPHTFDPVMPVGNVLIANRKIPSFGCKCIPPCIWLPLRFIGTYKNGDRKSQELSGTQVNDVMPTVRTRNDNFFESSSVFVNEITKEIHLYRDVNNNFTETTYIDMDAPYGPPLAILLPWLSPDESVIRRFVEVYGSRGFDVVTVQLSKNQLLYPRKDGGAIRTVANFLDYLNGSHRYRPYIVHGFSTGVYVYGEMMAQLSEQFETFYTIIGNIKGCLWDSPIEFSMVAPVAGKALYPRNFIKRWFFERAVAHHLAEHQRDSVFCWERSRDYFCRQKCKVPNLFFVSEKDLLSNPGNIEAVRNLMEQNGIPTYQKTWQDSKHLEHFTRHFDEYIHGMNLFFSLANLFPDPAGKFHSYSTNSHLTSIRLSKKARELR